MRPRWVVPFHIPFVVKLWAVAYGYSLFCAVALQTVVLPLMPSLHSGNGLLAGDARVFHDFAVAWAGQIHHQGWAAWSLFGSTATSGNVSLLAAFYAIFGPSPLSFIFLSSAFHALGGVLLYALYCRFTKSELKLAGIASAVVFLVFPSALVWYAQNHKDTFLIVGYLLALLGFIDIWRSTCFKGLLKGALAILAGLLIVACLCRTVWFSFQLYFELYLGANIGFRRNRLQLDIFLSSLNWRIVVVDDSASAANLR